MDTSMAYRLFRLYFNSNSDNYQLFGNRVHNPVNAVSRQGLQNAKTSAMIRVLLAGSLIAMIVLLSQI